MNIDLRLLLFLPPDSTCPPHLYGSLCYRDNVEDEWLVVWLLLEIGKQFPHLVTRLEPKIPSTLYYSFTHMRRDLHCMSSEWGVEPVKV